VMRFAEEKSIRQIAKQLKRSEGAVKQLQFRGLEGLRARIDCAQNPKPQRTRRFTKEKPTRKPGRSND